MSDLLDLLDLLKDVVVEQFPALAAVIVVAAIGGVVGNLMAAKARTDALAPCVSALRSTAPQVAYACHVPPVDPTSATVMGALIGAAAALLVVLLWNMTSGPVVK